MCGGCLRGYSARGRFGVKPIGTLERCLACEADGVDNGFDFLSHLTVRLENVCLPIVGCLLYRPRKRGNAPGVATLTVLPFAQTA
jgi:hypothetical protein